MLDSTPPGKRDLQVALAKKPERTKLSNNMVANIAILVAMALVSSLILLFGEFDGKVVRTVLTLLLFAAFTSFAAYDATRDVPPRYVMFSQVGHLYFLGLSLFLIWGTLAALPNFFDEFHVVTNTIFIVILVKAAVLLLQRVSDAVYVLQWQLSVAAKLAMAFLSIATFMFTLPLGTDYVLAFSEWYWKTAVLMVVCAAVSLCITVLLNYSFRTKTPSQRSSREQSRERVPVVSRVQDSGRSSGRPWAQFPGKGHEYARPATFGESPAQAARASEATTGSDGPPSYARPLAGPQPWPVFPNGQPLPAGKNGRPDFAVLEYVASVHAEAERQWFS